MFKEIKKCGLIDKIIIIIMANLKNDLKFDSGDECKGGCISAPKYNIQQHFILKTLTRIRCHRLKYK
jgi:hypothetical protein